MIAQCSLPGACTMWQMVLEPSWKNELTSGLIMLHHLPRRTLAPGLPDRLPAF
jgi:hypothetical protein